LPFGHRPVTNHPLKDYEELSEDTRAGTPCAPHEIDGPSDSQILAENVLKDDRLKNKRDKAATQSDSSLQANTVSFWTKSEMDDFEKGMRKYPKDFAKIKKQFMGKSEKKIKDLVEYYYIWKKPVRCDLRKNIGFTFSGNNARSEERSEESIRLKRKNEVIQFEAEESDSILEDDDEDILSASPYGSPASISDSDLCPDVREVKRRKVDSTLVDPLLDDDCRLEESFWDENGLSVNHPFGEIPFLGISNLNDSLQSVFVTHNARDSYSSVLSQVQNFKWTIPVEDENYCSTECDFISDILNTPNDPDFPY